MTHFRSHSLLLSALAAFISFVLIAPAANAQAPSAAPAQSVDDAAQVLFDSPQDAAVALIDAVRQRDRDALSAIIGPDFKRLVSGDLEVDEADWQRFVAAYDARNSLLDHGNGTYTLVMGFRNWEFPAPIVSLNGKFWFDGEQGVEEVLNRVIGEHELKAIAVCRAYPRIQQTYFDMDPDGDGVKEFASRLKSSEGKRDGLFWPESLGEPTSPIGPQVAEALESGELTRNAAKPDPYFGYYYRILTKQGPGAPGGAMNYLDAKGKMSAGFALIAWPAEYGDSGITTFIVARDGIVYQQDLGEQTAEAVKNITAYDPKGWTRVGKDGLPESPTAPAPPAPTAPTAPTPPQPEK